MFCGCDRRSIYDHHIQLTRKRRKENQGKNFYFKKVTENPKKESHCLGFIGFNNWLWLCIGKIIIRDEFEIEQYTKT